MGNTDLRAVLPKLLPDLLRTLVGVPTNDAVAEGDRRRANEPLKRLKSLAFIGQQIDVGSLGVLGVYLADVRVAAYGHWREGPHQVPVAQLEKPADVMVACLGVGKLSSLPHGANVAVRDSSLEYYMSAVSLA